MVQVSGADFDFASRVHVQTRAAELAARHHTYLRSHPELQQALHDLMENILLHKPADPLTFMQEQVHQLREKNEPVSQP